MTPHAIRAMLERSPFVPFRIHADGRHFVISRPDDARVGRKLTCVGVYTSGQSLPDHFAFVTNDHITALEPLDDADTPFVVG